MTAANESLGYQVVFEGRYIEGYAPEDVRKAFGIRFGTEAANTVFSVPRIVLKQNIGLTQAEKMQAALAGFGMKAKLERLPPEVRELSLVEDQPAAEDPGEEAAEAAAPAGTADRGVIDGRATKARPASKDTYSRQQITAAFQSAVSLPPVSAEYRRKLIAVAALMILLPLVYVAIALTSVYGLFWLATGGREVFFSTVRPGYLTLVVFGALFIAALLLTAFLFKPLFARTPRSLASVQIEPGREPVLFTLIECITEAVGAPMPEEILVDAEVNASARLTRGLLSKKLTLTIGLPLFWGCDAKTLTGVLAHEFGHFTQQWGMRAAWTVHWINRWFYRQVHERDSWDRFVDELLARDMLLLNLAAGLARLGSGFCRLLLVGLSYVAGLISYSFSRQMEFDADRYEVALVGSEQYERTVAALRILGAAQGAALADVGKALEAGKKIDNLPLLVARRAQRFSVQERQRIVSAIEEVNTDAFDTHPADQERIAAARALQAPATFELDGSAARLLREGERLSRVATLQWYRAIGLDVQPGDLAPLESFEAENDNLERAQQASLQYFAGLDDLPLWFDCPAEEAFVGMSDEELAAELTKMRGDLRLKRKEYAGRRDRLKLHRDYLAAYGHARFWRERGVETDPSSYRLKVSMSTLEEIDENLAEHRNVVAVLEQELAGCAAALGRQLGAGLELARRAGRTSGAELRQLRDAYDCLGQTANKARLLGATCDNLLLLIDLCERSPAEAKHQRQLNAEAERSTHIAEAIQNVLGRVEAFASAGPAAPAPDVDTVMSGTAAAQQAHADARELLAQLDRLVLGTRGRMAELALASAL